MHSQNILTPFKFKIPLKMYDSMITIRNVSVYIGRNECKCCKT